MKRQLYINPVVPLPVGSHTQPTLSLSIILDFDFSSIQKTGGSALEAGNKELKHQPELWRGFIAGGHRRHKVVMLQALALQNIYKWRRESLWPSQLEVGVIQQRRNRSPADAQPGAPSSLRESQILTTAEGRMNQ